MVSSLKTRLCFAIREALLVQLHLDHLSVISTSSSSCRALQNTLNLSFHPELKTLEIRSACQRLSVANPSNNQVNSRLSVTLLKFQSKSCQARWEMGRAAWVTRSMTQSTLTLSNLALGAVRIWGLHPKGLARTMMSLQMMRWRGPELWPIESTLNLCPVRYRRLDHCTKPNLL